MWFESLMGFREESGEQVRRNVTIVDDQMMSNVNGRQFVCGMLETPDLAELRQRVRQSDARKERLRLSEVVGDVQNLHRDPSNRGALFQVASQFNLLEMVSPSVTRISRATSRLSSLALLFT